jgi:hypothetical protein
VTDQQAAAILAQLEELRSDVQSLNAFVRARKRLSRPRPLDRETLAKLEALLPAIAEKTSGASCTVTDLLRFAAGEPVLEAAIALTVGPCDDKVGLRLGHLLRRAEGREIAGCKVERIGDVREGAYLKISRCSSAKKTPRNTASRNHRTPTAG